MIIKSEMETCRSAIQALVGKKVRLTSNGGRKRLIVREGTIEACYPNVFTVKCKRKNSEVYEMASYSYIDILSRTVRLSVFKEAADEAVG